MSFQIEKRECIKRYMLEKIRQNDTEFIAKTMENFDISVTTVKRYIRECMERGILCESGNGSTGYELTCTSHFFTYSQAQQLDEDVIFCEDIRPLLQKVSSEAGKIWYYAFSEMMNNAIEHSKGDRICCRVTQDYLHTEISIMDNGIGIFRGIQSFLEEHTQREVTYQDALLELYKGKFTTNPENHSGEGIFFTSKCLNEFAIWSENTIFSHGCFQKDRFVQSHLIAYYNCVNEVGTMVVMKLENQSKRTMKEVFDMFAPVDEGFVKTRIPIAEVCPYAEPIARSQARRILQRLEQFKEIEFDFDGVEFMGQGFADEIFRVFQASHPEIQLIPIHANRTVLGMIKHVKRE